MYKQDVTNKEHAEKSDQHIPSTLLRYYTSKEQTS